MLPDEPHEHLDCDLEPRQVWVVLDIDRTIVNTTTWYLACIEQDLLIPASLLPQFHRLNERAYGPDPDLPDAEFRAATLDLINMGRPRAVTEDLFDTAGRAIGAQVDFYEEPLVYLRLLRNQHGDDLRVLYLTAGYEPFMFGVLERLHQRAWLSGLNYRVVGSRLDIIDGTARLAHAVDGIAKAKLVQYLLDEGCRVALLADDDHHDLLPFDEVEARGGRTVRVIHRTGGTTSPAWQTFAAHAHPDFGRWQAITTGNQSYALADLESILAVHGDVFDDLPPAPNGIGIGELDRKQWRRALDRITARLTGPDAAIADRCLTRLSYLDGSRVLLRGDLYYLNAPPYLFGDRRPADARWTEQVAVSRQAWQCLKRGGVLHAWAELSRPERWLIMCVLDHLKNAASQALDAITRLSVREDRVVSDEGTDAFVRRVHTAYWAMLLSGTVDDGLADAAGWDALADLILSQRIVQFSLRELDDPHVVALSALSTLKRLAAADQWPGGVVDFLSGGLDIGVGFAVIAGLLYPHKAPVEIVHLAYSSKHRFRRPIPTLPKMSYERMLCYVPPHQRPRMSALVSGGAGILLYDNNVATFATLAEVKATLTQAGAAQVQAAVGCVYYGNILRHLNQAEGGEGLHDAWQEVLDHPPVSDYVTAFATWGTSTKTRILHHLYGRRPLRPAAPCTNRPDGPGMFKVCRVHNTVDLDAVVAAGATAIGIHAVAPPTALYQRQQERHVPLGPVAAEQSHLPLARYELAAIRHMVRRLPDHVLPVLVVERILDAADIRAVLAAYGMDTDDAVVQLQCRIDAEAIVALRDFRLICAVGAQQEDLSGYIGFLNRALDADRDLILVDFSAHQPDLISGVQQMAPEPADMERVLAALRGVRLPVLFADDSNPRDLAARAASAISIGVPVFGLDTQNAVEVPRVQQRYRWMDERNQTIAVLIRKSPDQLREWTRTLATVRWSSSDENQGGEK
jgi:hypothetical protein